MPKAKEEKDQSVFDTPEKIKRIKLRVNNLIKDILEKKPETLIFLDRGGRPISWILREAWKQKYPDQKLPPIRFIDLGTIKRSLQKQDQFNSGGVFDEAGLVDKEKIKEISNKVNNDEALVELMKILYNGSRQSALLVDDYIGSGKTMGLAKGFLTHHFPAINFNTYSFFSDMDMIIFRAPKTVNSGVWLGPWMPWNSDKSYTLMSSDEQSEEELDIVGKTEKDKRARQKGLELKKEIKQIFSN